MTSFKNGYNLSLLSVHVMLCEDQPVFYNAPLAKNGFVLIRGVHYYKTLQAEK